MDERFLDSLYEAAVVPELWPQVLRRFQAHDLCGWQARFSPDGRYAASAAEDGSIHIYDLSRPYRPVVPYAEFDD